jgi:uncharacterized protein
LPPAAATLKERSPSFPELFSLGNQFCPEIAQALDNFLQKIYKVIPCKQETKLMNRDEILSFLHQYKERNGGKYSIINIALFGSASRRAMSEQSDIDIVVELEDPDMFNLISIKQDLEEQLSRPVDIVRYREKMNSFLKARIEKEATYV